jgi:hypothetical protein
MGQGAADLARADQGDLVARHGYVSFASSFIDGPA